MTKSEERRSAILDRLADHVLSEGLSGSNLRPLAKAAGISDRMLLYYFKDKAEVITATIERIASRLVTLMTERAAKTPLPADELRPKLQSLVLADEFWPYMRLWLEIAAAAGRNDPLYRGVGEQLGRGFLAWAEAQLQCDSPGERRVQAARLFAMIEGTVLLKSLGMDDVCNDAM